MIKTPKRHYGAMSSTYMPNFINVSGIVFVLWPYNQSGTPARPSPPARRRPPAHRTDNFSKSDNNTLRQILAEGKNSYVIIQYFFYFFFCCKSYLHLTKQNAMPLKVMSSVQQVIFFFTKF